MAADAVKKITPSINPTSKSSFSNNTTEIIKTRRSRELVIGLCGAVGSGIKSLQEKLKYELQQHGYSVECIQLSDLISEELEAEELSKLGNSKLDRYTILQDKGDNLRKTYGPQVVAELAIRKITILREARYGNEASDDPQMHTQKVAYIINQIKHPSEIELLSEIYRNNFYLIGLLRTQKEREQNLREDRVKESEINKLIERDRKSSLKHGQQVEASLHKADYFIRNIEVGKDISSSVSRFIKLIHGIDNITPTNHEVGIYAAFSASLRSACLSRQVGAAIADDDGTIISTGCNDVPMFGGGLYNSNSSTDKRCFNKGGYCHNDKHKEILKEEIEEILRDNGITNHGSIAEEIFNNSKAKSIIEYSRAIHAEMDAIISLARSNSSNSKNKTLFCTTYPCHVCARHIVAAGIKKVIYIEPYEKSLALQLHSDSISHKDNHTSTDTVVFENFEGVAPKRYAKFFGYNTSLPRKGKDGVAIRYTVADSHHIDPQYLDGYNEYELKVVETLNTKMS